MEGWWSHGPIQHQCFLENQVCLFLLHTHILLKQAFFLLTLEQIPLPGKPCSFQ